MPAPAPKIRLIALLLGVLFLAGQFHFCADFQAGSSASHFCPVCSNGSCAIPVAIQTAATSLAVAPLELSGVATAALPSLASAVSSRAPPAL